MEKKIDVEITVVPTGKLNRAVALDMALEDNPDFIVPQGGENVNTESGNNNDGCEKGGDEIHVPEL